MTQLRPISLCNVLYKICAKVIANHLKPLISPFQSAFVPGRFISDNSLLAAKVGHFLHNKKSGRDGYLALKLDLNKA